MTIEFEAKGFREIEAALEGLGTPRELRRLATAALKRGTKPIVDRAKELAPKDERDLERSIKAGNPIRAFRERTPESVSTFIGIDESQDARLHIYAQNVEFGQKTREPQPFMRPALDEKTQETIEATATELWKGIERRAKQLARSGG